MLVPYGMLTTPTRHFFSDGGSRLSICRAQKNSHASTNTQNLMKHLRGSSALSPSPLLTQNCGQTFAPSTNPVAAHLCSPVFLFPLVQATVYGASTTRTLATKSRETPGGRLLMVMFLRLSCFQSVNLTGSAGQGVQG